MIVRLSVAEKAALRGAAQGAHLTISDYCRERLLRPGADQTAELGRLRAQLDAAVRRAEAADRRALQAIALGGG